MAHPSAETRTWLSRLVAYDTTSRESNLPLIEDVAAAARGLGAIVNVFPTPDGRKANLVVTVPDASGGVRGGGTEQDVTVSTRVSQALANLALFEKSQVIRSYGTGG